MDLRGRQSDSNPSPPSPPHGSKESGNAAAPTEAENSAPDIQNALKIAASLGAGVVFGFAAEKAGGERFANHNRWLTSYEQKRCIL